MLMENQTGIKEEKKYTENLLKHRIEIKSSLTLDNAWKRYHW